jgi:citrate lyase subunit beta/citryl-CoA lyase
MSVSSNQANRVWRSLLFVPANVDRFIEKAPDVGADAVQLDLEDSIAPNAKDAARANVADAAKRVSTKGADVTVRINRPWRLAVRDLEAAVIPEVAALALPMVDSPEHVREVSNVVGELERERGMEAGHVGLIVLIETPDGFFRARDIAASDPRIIGVSLGSEDFARAVGMVSEPDTLGYPKQHIIFAARAAGVVPMGFIGSIADLSDMEAFRQIVRRSRRFGFRGASCIHPNQIAVCNEEFAPSAEEVEAAREIVAAYDTALAAGTGAIKVGGKMIDIPVADAARELLEFHDALQAKANR